MGPPLRSKCSSWTPITSLSFNGMILTSQRVLAAPALELVTTVITVEEQLRGRLDRSRRARSDEQIVRA
jgi:hypothetical protein